MSIRPSGRPIIPHRIVGQNCANTTRTPVPIIDRADSPEIRSPVLMLPAFFGDLEFDTFDSLIERVVPKLLGIE